MRWAGPGVMAGLVWAGTGSLASAQQAIVDTAVPFVAGSVQNELLLRGPVGWDTYQSGTVAGLQYRFDPDGYARFGASERLDEDYWEIVCTPQPIDCTGKRGPVVLRVDAGGYPAIEIENANPEGRFRPGDESGPALTLAELSAPAHVGELLAASELQPESGGAPVPIAGIGTVARYIRWVENGQAPDLRADANPYRPMDLPAEAPAAAAPPEAEVDEPPPGASDAGDGADAVSALAAKSEPLSIDAPSAVGSPDLSGATAAATAAAGLAGAALAAQNSSSSDNNAPQPASPPAGASPATATATPAAPIPLTPLAAAQSTAKQQSPAGGVSEAATADTGSACAPLPTSAMTTPVGSLRGLPGVLLFTGYLSEPPALKGRLQKQVLDAGTERLKLAGIRLLTEQEVENTPGKPRLELYLTNGDPAKGCDFRVFLSLRQEVVLARDPSLHMITGTWGDGGLSRAGQDRGAELATFVYYIDRFIDDYRKANSGGLEKKPASSPAAAKPAPAPASSPTAVPSAAPAGVDDPALVLPIQAALREAGYNPGPADGILGMRTRQAIQSFQQRNGLQPTGVAGAEVLERLLALKPEGPRQ